MHHTRAKLCSAAQQFGAPRLCDRALFAGLKAVDECGRDSGTLLGREPKDVFKHMANSSVPVERQSIQQAARAASSRPEPVHHPFSNNIRSKHWLTVSFGPRSLRKRA